MVGRPPFVLFTNAKCPTNAKHRTAIYLQPTMDVNVYHKEMSGDLINVIKNGLEFLFKIIIV